MSPHSFAATRGIILSDLGATIDDIFEEFDKRVIGVGAIAQVYKAKIKGHPGYVAVKVLHPGVEDQVYADLLLLKWASRLCSVIPACRWLSLTDEAETFAAMMVDQLDLNKEGHHLTQYRKEFRTWRSVVFPQPIQIDISTDGHIVVSATDELNNDSGHRV